MADEELFTYAATPRGETGVEADIVPTDVEPQKWREPDKSRHEGTEYTFEPGTGLPPLRLEWSPRTDGASYGLGVLFMATRADSPYAFDGAKEHPDSEDHFRTNLFEPWNLLFPDKTSVRYDRNLHVVAPDDPDEDAQTVTVDDAVAEAVRRYHNELAARHPDPTADLREQLIAHAEDIAALGSEYADLHAQAIEQHPEMAPDLPIVSVVVIPPGATEPVTQTVQPPPSGDEPADLAPGA